MFEIYDDETGFTLVGVFLLIGIALMSVMLVFRLILKKELKEGIKDV